MSTYRGDPSTDRVTFVHVPYTGSPGEYDVYLDGQLTGYIAGVHANEWRVTLSGLFGDHVTASYSEACVYATATLGTRPRQSPPPREEQPPAPVPPKPPERKPMQIDHDDYRGPILAGSRWRSRGTSGHTHYMVTVLRLTANQQVIISYEGNRKGKGRRRPVIPEPAFRNNYVLYAQPPGYRAPTEREETLVAKGMVRAERLLQQIPPGVFGDTSVATASIPDPITGERTEVPLMGEITPGKLDIESLRVQALAVEGIAPPAPRPEPAPAPPPPPPPTPPTPTPQPTAISQFVDAGVVVLEQTKAAVLVLERTVETLSEQLTAAQTDLDAARTRHDQLEAAVLTAIGLAGETQPATPAQPTLFEPGSESVVGVEVDQSVNVDVREESEAPQIYQKPQMLIWTLERIKRDGRLSLPETKAEFARVYNTTTAIASKRMSTILNRQVDGGNPNYPRVARQEPGIYVVA